MNVYRYRLVFKRTAQARQMTQRDQMNFFRELFSGVLPLAFFEKKAKLAFGPAISVGHESLCEYVDVCLEKRMGMKEMEEALAASAASGFELSAAKSIPLFFPSIEKSVAVTEYELFPGSEDAELETRMAENMEKDEIIYRKEKASGEIKTTDLKKFVFSWKVTRPVFFVTLLLRHIQGVSVKPEAVLAAAGGYEGKVERILRKRMYWIDSRGELVVL